VACFTLLFGWNTHYVLYHRTSKDAAKLILSEGLKPIQRRYVHLSTDKYSAFVVGKRKELEPVILSIAARKAYLAYITFY